MLMKFIRAMTTLDNFLLSCLSSVKISTLRGNFSLTWGRVPEDTIHETRVTEQSA